MKRLVAAIALVFLVASSARSADVMLKSGDATLTFKAGRPVISGPGVSTTATAAAIVEFRRGTGAPAERVYGAYESTSKEKDRVVARATVKSAAGSVVTFVDTWAASPHGGFIVDRLVEVTSVGAGDEAFGTELEFDGPGVKSFGEADVFVPGLWYADARAVPASGLISDVGQRDFLLREDRMALPLVSMRNKKSQATITLTHVSPDGATIGADAAFAPLVDARLRFASLGVRRGDEGLRIVFRFPGSEGEQTSVGRFRRERRTAERWHPTALGAKQYYRVRVSVGRCEDFGSQLRGAWRAAWDEARPQAAQTDLDATFRASVSVLKSYHFDRGGVSGIPFSAKLPGGDVPDYSLQMGFVGQQLPCAAYLIDEGLRTGDAELIGKGERIAEFWVRESLSPQGVPRTWYDVDPQPHWRNYNTFLRVATDGTTGLLRAWQIEQTAGRKRDHWLKFCRDVGDWLLKIQNADGSFFREWTHDGKAASQSTTSTLHPVRLLVDLSCATGEMKYRRAAERAAEWSLQENQDGATYIGGTPDNPDVKDKEAGWIAFDSYLALYDVTQDARWLVAATNAAAFTETWIYAWSPPLPPDGKEISVPRVDSFVGSNLIATGHSGADQFLAYASLSYFRLSLYTGDEHWADVGELLQQNSARFVDVGGSLGYAKEGLIGEAFTLAVRRGSGVGAWLPWCTSAIMEPMARGREIFGTVSVREARKTARGELTKANRAFGATRGFVPQP